MTKSCCKCKGTALGVEREQRRDFYTARGADDMLECREWTIQEEIEHLNIPNDVKSRIINKINDREEYVINEIDYVRGEANRLSLLTDSYRRVMFDLIREYFE